MKNKWFLSLLLLILAALACNWSDVVPPAAPVIEPSPLPTFAISTLTSTPTETPLPTLTSTPDVPIAWPKDLGVNCRYGPGKEWEVVSSLLPDKSTEIKGRTVDATWWYVSDPLNPDGFCWVAYDVVDTAGNLNVVPLAQPPTASVTNITVEALATFIACGEPNPVTLNGSIKTNGPTMVIYHWEVNGDIQETLPDATLKFSQAGAQQVSTDSFSADCGTYTVSLVTTAPDEMSAVREFSVRAP